MNLTAPNKRSADIDRLDARDPALIARILPFMRASNRRYLRLRSQGPGRPHSIAALSRESPRGAAADHAQLALAAAMHDVRGALDEITVPTLVLAGEHDALLGTEAPRALAAAIRGATFTIIAGAGHDLTLEQPLTTAARVALFFAERAG